MLSIIVKNVMQGLILKGDLHEVARITSRKVIWTL